ncbi:hypothetical protein D3876_00350 [Sphingomonas cavernae]|uniref:Uncharacterized protein n=1 Tax=Sphingomonas cavernae TaxID=2320861 RepID=A0A418WNR4_9SPHN|nr:hypothetical protein D3876_00350 [Sphingomonas cavernae]
MVPSDDSDYFLRREREERIAAACATHPAARSVHLDMANRYLARASASIAGARRLRRGLSTR